MHCLFNVWKFCHSNLGVMFSFFKTSEHIFLTVLCTSALILRCFPSQSSFSYRVVETTSNCVGFDAMGYSAYTKTTVVSNGNEPNFDLVSFCLFPLKNKIKQTFLTFLICFRTARAESCLLSYKYISKVFSSTSFFFL